MSGKLAPTSNEISLMIEEDALKYKLIYAVIRKDIPKIEEAIREGIDLELKDGYGCTALHHAAMDGHYDVVEFLLAKGAKIDAVDEGNRTPLFHAARHGFNEIVELLLVNGANIEVVSNTVGYSALVSAIIQRQTACIKLLLEYGAKVDSIDRIIKSPVVEINELLTMGKIATKICRKLHVEPEDNVFIDAHAELASILKMRTKNISLVEDIYNFRNKEIIRNDIKAGAKIKISELSRLQDGGAPNVAEWLYIIDLIKENNALEESLNFSTFLYILKYKFRHDYIDANMINDDEITDLSPHYTFPSAIGRAIIAKNITRVNELALAGQKIKPEEIENELLYYKGNKEEQSEIIRILSLNNALTEGLTSDTLKWQFKYFHRARIEESEIDKTKVNVDLIEAIHSGDIELIKIYAESGKKLEVKDLYEALLSSSNTTKHHYDNMQAIINILIRYHSFPTEIDINALQIALIANGVKIAPPMSFSIEHLSGCPGLPTPMTGYVKHNKIEEITRLIEYGVEERPIDKVDMSHLLELSFSHQKISASVNIAHEYFERHHTTMTSEILILLLTHPTADLFSRLASMKNTEANHTFFGITNYSSFFIWLAANIRADLFKHEAFIKLCEIFPGEVKSSILYSMSIGTTEFLKEALNFYKEKASDDDFREIMAYIPSIDPEIDVTNILEIFKGAIESCGKTFETLTFLQKYNNKFEYYDWDDRLKDYDPYFWAIKLGNKVVLQFLLENNLKSPSAIYSNTYPSNIDLATRLGNLDIVKIFVEAGDDINRVDEDKNTPLHAAFIKGKHAIAEYLIKNGADITLENKHGQVPFDFITDSSVREYYEDLMDNLLNPEIGDGAILAAESGIHAGEDQDMLRPAAGEAQAHD